MESIFMRYSRFRRLLRRLPLGIFTLLVMTIGIAGLPQRTAAQTTPPPNVIITLTGENFTRQSTVFIGTSQFTPEFVSANMLRVSIPRTMLSSAQPNNVRVVNPSAGGGSSQGLPLVVACRANNAVFADVSIVTNTYTFHQLDSARYIDPPYSNTPISQEQRRELAIMNIPSEKKMSISGKIFYDGEAELRFENLANSQTTFTPDEVKYMILKSVSDSTEHYNKDNILLFKTLTGTKPYKYLVDKIQTIRRVTDSIRQVYTNPVVTTTSAAAAAPNPPTNPPLSPTDSSAVLGNIVLHEAFRMGFVPQRIGTSSRFSVVLNRNILIPNDPIGTVKLAENEEIEFIVNTANDVIEEVRTFKINGSTKTLTHRTIQRYTFDANNRIRWQSRVDYSYYELNGLPMVFGNAEIFENYQITTFD